MPRTAVWATTRSVEGTTTQLPRWVNLLPPTTPLGSTVIRVIGSAQASATHDSTTEPPRPIHLTVGVLYGPEPAALQIVDPALSSTDWMWFGAASMVPATFGTTTIYYTLADGPIQTVTTRARRILGTGSSVWMGIWPTLTAARTFTSSFIVARTLYLLPA